jgi:hypothetical protein
MKRDVITIVVAAVLTAALLLAVCKFTQPSTGYWTPEGQFVEEQ